MLFNDCRKQTGNANAVAAHDDRKLTSVFVKHDGIQILGIARAELEDMSDFDSARELETAFSVRRNFPFLNRSEICKMSYAEIATKVGIEVVETVLVCADAGICHVFNVKIS